MAENNDQSAYYALGVSVILASLLLSASVYFSLGGLANTITSKQFSVNVDGLAAAQPAAADQQPADTVQPEPAPVAPPSFQASTINITGRPSIGAQDSKVVLVEFSDFECPFCGRAAPTVSQALAAYNSTMKLVFMEYPLPAYMHPNAQKAAEAAECAYDQGKFWEMHDKLFANQQALGVDQLKGYAKDIGLDTAKFDECLDAGNKTEQINSDIAQGGQLGTPSFVIYATGKDDAQKEKLLTAYNYISSLGVGPQLLEVDGAGYGIFFSGALPYEAFQKSIDALN